MHVFIITFDQFKASLLNKSINFYTSLPKKEYNYTDFYSVTVAFYSRSVFLVVNYSLFKVACISVSLLFRKRHLLAESESASHSARLLSSASCSIV